jgi:predicted transposase YbfD/YdcC
VIRHLQRNLPPTTWDTLTDTRDPRGIRHPLPAQMSALALGMATAQRTLGDVVDLVADIPRRQKWALTRIPSETTLWRAPQRLIPAELRALLRKQVKAMHRSKQLAVLPDIGLSLLAIDGKVIASDNQRLHPESLDHNRRDGGGPFLLRVLRAVLVGCAVKPVFDQHVIPATQGEANHVIGLVEALIAAYGKTDLLECISFDAGLNSRKNCHFIDDQGIGFIAALKGDQPTLHAEALRLLGQGEAPPPGGWERSQEEVRGGRHVRLFFARTSEMVGCNGWGCIRQVWRVRTIRQRGAKVEEEDRYFVTNLVWGRLGAAQCLGCVRAHWGIENDSNWTLDVMWGEDQYAWCRQGVALETLAVLRCLVYNVVRLLRCRALRSHNNRTLPYRRLFKRIERALVTEVHPATQFG